MKTGDIAAALNGSVAGDENLLINRACHPSAARDGNDLAVAILPQFLKSLATTKAGAAIIPQGVSGLEIACDTIISVPAGRRTLPELTELFRTRPAIEKGIHKTSHIEEGAQIADEVFIGPFCHVARSAKIAGNVTLCAQVSIGENVEIGENTIIHPGARIGANVKIGSGCTIQPNVVIGSDGFSFLPVDAGNVEAAKATGNVASDPNRDSTLLKIESLGGVIIEDDVEVGANSVIDSGTFLPTRIGRGTKIDNLVQIGHNVQVGEDCLLCGQVGLAGSVQIGDRVTMGGRAAAADNIKIGDDVVIGASSAAATNIASNNVYLGTPAVPRERALRDIQNIRRLDRIIKKVLGK